MTRGLLLGACGLLLSISPALAQGTAPEKTSPDSGQAAKTTPVLNDRLDFHIDSWVKGTITALDTAKGTMAIKGEDMPYATAYAKMLREIHDQTADITSMNQKQSKETEIRQSWQARLDSSLKETPATDKTFDLRVPPGMTLDVLALNQISDLDYLQKDKVALSSTSSDKSLAAPVIDNGKVAPDSTTVSTNRLSLADLKVGDVVMCGFDSGFIHNDAYALIRDNAPAKAIEKPAVK